MKIYCLRCNGIMKREKKRFRLADYAFRLLNFISVDIFICEQCGKVEFYKSGSVGDLDSEDFDASAMIAQTKCPNCGDLHDIDYPKCPKCGYKDLRENNDNIEQDDI